MSDGVEVLACYAERATFRVDTPRGSVVVKVDHEPERSRREVDAMQRAAAAGVPIAPILSYDPAPPTVLALPFVDGVPLSSAYPEAAVNAGRHVRAFHDLGGNPPYGGHHTRWDEYVLACMLPEIDYLEGTGDVSSRTAAQLRSAFESAAGAMAGRGTALLHNDLQTGHVLVDGRQVTAILDFADSEAGDPLFDIAVLTLFDDSLLEPFLDGYGADESFRKTGERLLPIYQLLRHVGAVRWLRERGYPAGDHLERIAAVKPLRPGAVP